MTVLALVALGALAIQASPDKDLSVPPRLVVIGLDGADPAIVRRLAKEGLLPNLARLRRDGSSGVLFSPPPRISPLLWTSMMTGRYPEDHGILDFFQPVSGGSLRPVLSTTRRAKTLWEILGDRGHQVGVVGFLATWPPRPVRGALVSDLFSPVLFVPGKPTRKVVYPQAFDGELDRVRRSCPSLPSELKGFYELKGGSPDASTGLQRLRTALEATQRIHRATLATIAEFHPDLLFVYHELIDVASHLFMRYTEPPLKGVSSRDVELFGGLVDAVYRYEDRLVGDLLERAGPKARVIVVSDHGFKNGSDRPATDPSDFRGQAATWHEDEALILLSGPGITAGKRIRGTLYDLAPTVLDLEGCRAARDMPGRSLLSNNKRPRVPSYGVPAPVDLARGSGFPEEQEEALRALGYLEESESPSEISANGYINLGLSLAYRGERRRSRAAYLRALAIFPDQPSALYDLAASLQDAGREEDALPLLVRLCRLDTAIPDGALLRLARAATVHWPEHVAVARRALDARPRRWKGVERDVAEACLMALDPGGDLPPSARAIEPLATVLLQEGAMGRLEALLRSLPSIPSRLADAVRSASEAIASPAKRARILSLVEASGPDASTTGRDRSH